MSDGGYLNLWESWASPFSYPKVLKFSMRVDGLTLHKVRFRSDGKQCLVAVKKGVVAWDIEKSQLTQTPPTYVHTLSPDGRFSLRLESDEKWDCLLMEDLQKERPAVKISIPDTHLFGWSISFDHKLLAIADDTDDQRKKFLIWDLRNKHSKMFVYSSAE